MTVDSYLELYSTLIGWRFYGVIWDVLAETGIAYLPFLGILLENWTEPARGGEFGNAWNLSQKRMEIDLFLAFFVLGFAGIPNPLTPFDATRLSYEPPPMLGEPAPATATPGDSKSTFGSNNFQPAPLEASLVDVPPWWYTVVSLSSAFNHAIVAGLPDSGDLRALRQQAQLAEIKAPDLRAEVMAFHSQCFVRARSKYLRERPDVAAILDAYGDEDPDWMGSHVYRTLAGYYDALRAQRQIAGWPYDAARDIEYDPAQAHQWGQPTCRQWWEDAEKGIRQKLIAEAHRTSDLPDAIDSAWDYVKGFVAGGFDAEKRQDLAAKALLEKVTPVYSNTDLDSPRLKGLLAEIPLAEEVRGLVSGLGTGLFYLLFQFVIEVLVPALLLVQPLILLGIYALLPFIVILSRYALSMLVLGGMAIFTVKFWTVLWHIAAWLDENLMLALYPGTGDNLMAFLGSTIQGRPGEHTTNRMLLDMITASLYFGLPLLWSGMMAWIGLKVGRGIGDIVSETKKIGSEAGGKGASVASGAAKGALKSK